MRLQLLILLGFLTFQLANAQNENYKPNYSQNFNNSKQTEDKFNTFGKLYFGTLMGKDNSDNPRTDFSIGGAGGILLNENIEAGLGIDVLIYDNFTNIAPHVHFAYSLLKNSAIRPFVEANLGYNFVAEANNYQAQYYDEFSKKGSVYTNAGLGIRIMNNSNNYIAVSGGYSYVQNTINLKYSWNAYEETISEKYNRYYLSFAFGF